MRQISITMLTAAAMLVGCANGSSGARMRTTVQVPAAAETAPVGTGNADAADDPAIFVRNDRRAFRFAGETVDGLILGTDKKAGLYVFGLDGRVLQFMPEGRLNNVDLRGVGDGFLAAASDRDPGRSGIALYRYTGSGELVRAGFVASDVGEPYGFCMGRRGDDLIAVLVAKDGQVRQYLLRDNGGVWSGTEERRFAVGSQSEGCAIDDTAQRLYIGEENVGLWQYGLEGDAAARTAVARVGDGSLVADVEGVTVLDEGAARYLLVSSQGDSAFAVWRIDGDVPVYSGRFHVAAHGDVDEVTGTDGIDAIGGRVGPYADGLVVVQDDANGGADAQNFKLIGWSTIRAALQSD